jgi:hypothetical protein
MVWATVDSYRLAVTGWDLDPSSTQSFTLRDAGLPPPENDKISAARDLGEGVAFAATDSFLGATRSSGDPHSSNTLPTLWYRFTSPVGSVAAQIFTNGKARLYRGFDPAILIDHPPQSDWVGYLDEPYSVFYPLNQATQFFVALSGGGDAVNLRIRVIQPGVITPINPKTLSSFFPTKRRWQRPLESDKALSRGQRTFGFPGRPPRMGGWTGTRLPS